MFVGLTGGMGCGKSAVCDIFARLNWMVLDADKLCHSLYDSGEERFRELLMERWGNSILDGDGTNLDRRGIASIVFNSSEEREWLNSIIHPIVLQKALAIKASNPGRDYIFGVPLLFEANWEEKFDAIISVWTEDPTRKRRLCGRGMTRDEIAGRDSAQISPERKMEMSDYALINNGDLRNLKAQCEILSQTLGKEKIRK
ncbi:MAG: dephospho-CoA kinase [Victivallales bacterium]|nr:dephospho-CoA kinase [Victivallales bacterium]